MSNPSVEKAENVEDFNRIVEQSIQLLSNLKPTDEDYENIYNELKELNVAISANPSLQQINVEIQKVQSAKDRLSQIIIDVHRNFLMRKRICEILREGWSPFSNQNSAEKRKGEAFLKMKQFIESATEAESLYKAAAHIMKNLDSKHESLSRQVTVFSMAMKLNDFSSGGNVGSMKNAASAILSASKSINSDTKEIEDQDEEDEPIYDWGEKK